MHSPTPNTTAIRRKSAIVGPDTVPLVQALIVPLGRNSKNEHLRLWWQATAKATLPSEQQSSRFAADGMLTAPGAFTIVAGPNAVINQAAPADRMTIYALVRYQKVIRPILWGKLQDVQFTVLAQGAASAVVVAIPVAAFRLLQHISERYLPQMSSVVEAICADPHYIEGDVRAIGMYFANRSQPPGRLILSKEFLLSAARDDPGLPDVTTDDVAVDIFNLLSYLHYLIVFDGPATLLLITRDQVFPASAKLPLLDRLDDRNASASTLTGGAGPYASYLDTDRTYDATNLISVQSPAQIFDTSRRQPPPPSRGAKYNVADDGPGGLLSGRGIITSRSTTAAQLASLGWRTNKQKFVKLPPPTTVLEDNQRPGGTTSFERLTMADVTDSAPSRHPMLSGFALVASLPEPSTFDVYLPQWSARQPWASPAQSLNKGAADRPFVSALQQAVLVSRPCAANGTSDGTSVRASSSLPEIIGMLRKRQVGVGLCCQAPSRLLLHISQLQFHHNELSIQGQAVDNGMFSFGVPLVDFYTYLASQLRMAGILVDVLRSEWKDAFPSRSTAALTILHALFDKKSFFNLVLDKGCPSWMTEAGRLASVPVERRILELQLARLDANGNAEDGSLIQRTTSPAGYLASADGMAAAFAVRQSATGEDSKDRSGQMASSRRASLSSPASRPESLTSFLVPLAARSEVAQTLLTELKSGTLNPQLSGATRNGHPECKKKLIVGLSCAECRGVTLRHLLSIMQVRSAQITQQITDRIVGPSDLPAIVVLVDSVIAHAVKVIRDALGPHISATTKYVSRGGTDTARNTGSGTPRTPPASRYMPAANADMVSLVEESAAAALLQKCVQSLNSENAAIVNSSGGQPSPAEMRHATMAAVALCVSAIPIDSMWPRAAAGSVRKPETIGELACSFVLNSLRKSGAAVLNVGVLGSDAQEATDLLPALLIMYGVSVQIARGGDGLAPLSIAAVQERSNISANVTKSLRAGGFANSLLSLLRDLLDVTYGLDAFGILNASSVVKGPWIAVPAPPASKWLPETAPLNGSTLDGDRTPTPSTVFIPPLAVNNSQPAATGSSYEQWNIAGSSNDISVHGASSSMAYPRQLSKPAEGERPADRGKIPALFSKKSAASVAPLPSDLMDKTASVSTISAPIGSGSSEYNHPWIQKAVLRTGLAMLAMVLANLEKSGIKLVALASEPTEGHTDAFKPLECPPSTTNTPALVDRSDDIPAATPALVLAATLSSFTRATLQFQLSELSCKPGYITTRNRSGSSMLSGPQRSASAYFSLTEGNGAVKTVAECLAALIISVFPSGQYVALLCDLTAGFEIVAATMPTDAAGLLAAFEIELHRRTSSIIAMCTVLACMCRRGCRLQAATLVSKLFRAAGADQILKIASALVKLPKLTRHAEPPTGRPPLNSVPAGSPIIDEVTLRHLWLVKCCLQACTALSYLMADVIDSQPRLLGEDVEDATVGPRAVSRQEILANIRLADRVVLAWHRMFAIHPAIDTVNQYKMTTLQDAMRQLLLASLEPNQEDDLMACAVSRLLLNASATLCGGTYKMLTPTSSHVRQSSSLAVLCFPSPADPIGLPALVHVTFTVCRSGLAALVTPMADKLVMGGAAAGSASADGDITGTRALVARALVLDAALRYCGIGCEEGIEAVERAGRREGESQPSPTAGNSSSVDSTFSEYRRRQLAVRTMSRTIQSLGIAPLLTRLLSLEARARETWLRQQEDEMDVSGEHAHTVEMAAIYDDNPSFSLNFNSRSGLQPHPLGDLMRVDTSPRASQSFSIKLAAPIGKTATAPLTTSPTLVEGDPPAQALTRVIDFSRPLTPGSVGQFNSTFSTSKSHTSSASASDAISPPAKMQQAVTRLEEIPPARALTLSVNTASSEMEYTIIPTVNAAPQINPFRQSVPGQAGYPISVDAAIAAEHPLIEAIPASDSKSSRPLASSSSRGIPETQASNADEPRIKLPLNVNGERAPDARPQALGLSIRVHSKGSVRGETPHASPPSSTPTGIASVQSTPPRPTIKGAATPISSEMKMAAWTTRRQSTRNLEESSATGVAFTAGEGGASSTRKRAPGLLDKIGKALTVAVPGSSATISSTTPKANRGMASPGGKAIPTLVLPLSTKKGKPGGFALLRDASEGNLLATGPRRSRAGSISLPMFPGLVPDGNVSRTPTHRMSIQVATSDDATPFRSPSVPPMDKNPLLARDATARLRSLSTDVALISLSARSPRMAPEPRLPDLSSPGTRSSTHQILNNAAPLTADVQMPGSPFLGPIDASEADVSVLSPVKAVPAAAQALPADKQMVDVPEQPWTEIDNLCVGYKVALASGKRGLKMLTLTTPGRQQEGSDLIVTYMQARAKSVIYGDADVHASVVVLLMSCLLLPNGVAFKSELVGRLPTAALVTMDAAGQLHRTYTYEESAREWNAMGKGHLTAQDSAGNAATSSSGTLSAGPSPHPPLLSQSHLGRSWRGPLPEAVRDSNQAAGLKRIFSSAASSRLDVSARHAKKTFTSSRLSNETERKENKNSRHSSASDTWSHLDTHPVYVLQCHLNHPGNVALVNIQLRELCEQRGFAFLRLLRLLSAEFFQPANYELREHIASGAYGSVVAAIATAESPAAAAFGVLQTISAVSKPPLLVQQGGFSRNGTVTKTTPRLEFPNSSRPTEQGIGQSRNAIKSLPLAIPARPTAQEPMMASDELSVAVKVISLPDDPTERCVIADVLPEVAIMEDLTRAYMKRHESKLTSVVQRGHPSSGTITGCPIVCLLDYGVTTSSCWIVMEHCSTSLRHWRLEEARMEETCTPDQVRALLSLFLCVTYRLSELHVAGVTHYDVKCDNVLLRPGYEAVLNDLMAPRRNAVDSTTVAGSWKKLLPYVCFTDFGESTYQPGLNAASVPLEMGRGTECIKAPEVLKALRPLNSSGDVPAAGGLLQSSGAACDVWGVGCLLFELLTGFFLFHDDNWARFYLTVTGDDPGSMLAAENEQQAVLDSSQPAQPGRANASLPLISGEKELLMRTSIGIELCDKMLTVLQAVLVRDPVKRLSPRSIIAMIEELIH